MNILFIGNSYTYYNDMPDTLAEIARSEGLSWTVEAVTKGGWTLSQFADEEGEMYPLLREKLAQPWDAVFLQEQSHRPITDYRGFLRGAADVCAMMEKRPARLLLYVTWGRNDAHPLLHELNMTRQEMTKQLHTAYAAAAEQIGAQLSDVGGAFAYAKERCPAVSLYDPDNSHPSRAGSYLAALIHFASLTTTLPLKATLSPTASTQKETDALLDAARAFLA